MREVCFGDLRPVSVLTLVQYDEHWRDPSQTSIMWLGLLFSILGITMLAYHQYGEPPEYEGISEALFQLYRVRTAQCLQSGDVAKCLPYTVETLRFNATAELNRKDDNRRGLWIMTGVVVRAAVNMGYHREPSSTISALQAEYRRRTWLSVINMDDMASFIGGFPRMRSALYSDAMEPRNLHEWELSEDMSSLPLSRPLTEPTSMTYLIVKGRLLHAIGRISDFNCAPTLGLYETVLEIDRAVCEAYESFPPHMKIAPIDDRGSTGELTMAGFPNLSLLGMYHRGMCALHRRFLAKGRTDRHYQPSRDRCISSALALLNFQQHLEPAFYRFSQTRQMLTLGASILLLELELRRSVPAAEEFPDSGLLFQTLEASCTHWEGAMSLYEEAVRVHQLLSSLLSDLHPERRLESAILQHTPNPTDPYLEPLDTSAPLETPSAGFIFDETLSDMDIDWVCLYTCLF